MLNKIAAMWLISAYFWNECQLSLTQNFNIPSCVRKEDFTINNLFPKSCDNFIKYPEIFLYKSEEMYKNIVSFINPLSLSQLSSPFCNSVVRTYICNALYPPCINNGTIPLGICEEECIKFVLMEHTCSKELDILFDNEGNFDRQCNNTLQVVEDAGILVNQSSECLNITELILSSTAITAETATSWGDIATDMHSNILVKTLVPILVVFVLFSLISLIILTIIIWRLHARRSLKVMKEDRNALQKNSYESRNTNNTNLKEVKMFSLNVEDVLENLLLKSVTLSFDCLIIHEEIGHGSFGTVFQGKYTPQSEKSDEDSIDVAVKTIKHSTASYTDLKGFLEESAIMCGFDHPHVLGLIGICLDPSNSPHLLLPFMENGDLRSYLKNKRKSSGILNTKVYPKDLNCNVLVKMCLEVAQGMEYMADKKLVHRDLAARNCMVDGNLSIKVADFGLTRDIYETDYYKQSHDGRVPVKWMAPESLHDRVSNEKTDVWSFGVTCWEIFSLGRTPYPALSNFEVIEYLERGNRLKKPELCPQNLYETVKSCWTNDPHCRPSFSQICISIQGLKEAPKLYSKSTSVDVEITQK